MNQQEPIKTIYGTKMYIDKDDSLGIGRHGYYETETLEVALIYQLVKPDWICLDIGAHIGYFTMIMAKRCEAVYAFEAEPRNEAILVKNIWENEIHNVVCRSVIITDEEDDDMANLYICKDNSGMHRCYPSKLCSDLSISVPTMKIDKHLHRAEFIKMDIEGAELGALKGMQRLLEKHHPIILMEFHPPSIIEYGADPEEEYHFLKTLGYDIRLLPDTEKGKSISYEELVEKTSHEWGGRNILCQYVKR